MTSAQKTIKNLFQQGLIHAKAGRNAQARDAFRRALELAPNNDTLWLYLAGVSDAPADALNAIQQAAALNPGNPSLPKAQAWFKETWPDYSAVSRQPSAVSRQPSAVSRQPSAVSHQPSAVSRQPSAVSRQPSAISAG